MRRSMWGPGIAALALVAASAASASAQGPQAQQPGAAQQPGDSAGIQLIYERELYSYSDRGRRDPFAPLSDTDTGPRFEELALQGVIYSTGQGRSVALIADAAGRVHRVRVGDRVGNSRVVEIGPLRVVMAVENFGTIRQEMLELKKTGGADR